MEENQEKENQTAGAPSYHPASFVALTSVLDFLGASPNQDKDKNKWKLHGKGNIAVKGQAWWDLNNEKGGKGAVSFAAHAQDISKREAIAWLMENFPDEIDMTAVREMDMGGVEAKKEFAPPFPVPENNKYVKKYLVSERMLPEDIIDNLINSGKIYADDRKRCIFLGTGSAEVRGTTISDDFKGCVTGSDTENSGFTIPPSKKPNTIAIAEAAIDAISYYAMHKDYFCISSNGSGRFILHNNIVNEALQNKMKVVLAFDADYAGDKAAQKVFNAQYLKYYISKQLNVPLEQVNNWMIEKEKGKELKMIFEEKDNQLFFAKNCYVPEQSIIRFQATPGLHSIFKDPSKTYQVKVSQKGFDFINQFISRDRPQLTKDWNEEWKTKSKMSLAP